MSERALNANRRKLRVSLQADQILPYVEADKRGRSDALLPEDIRNVVSRGGGLDFVCISLCP